MATQTKNAERKLESARVDSQESLDSAQQAVIEGVRSWANAVRPFVPDFYLRPAVAVHSAFDFAQQVLDAQRQVATELLGQGESLLRNAQAELDLDGSSNGSNG